MMRRFQLALLGMATALGALNGMAAQAIYQNFGTVTNTPMIDATSFANYGLFQVSADLPFETINTLNFTNRGVMEGSPGFRFEYRSTTGVRRSMANWDNGVDSSITASSFGGFFFGLPRLGSGAESSQIRVHATNLVNRGHLRVENTGGIGIVGSAVDLERSSIGVLPIQGGASSASPTNFFPETAITDIYWGMNNENNVVVPIASIVQAVPRQTNIFSVASPFHTVTNETGFGFGTRIVLDGATGFGLTNAVTETNIIVQAVFVQVSDPAFEIDVRFLASSIPTNAYQTPVVLLSNLETNVLDGGEFLTELYISDMIAAETNFFPLTNLVTFNTFRPSNYDVSRVPPFGFQGGESPQTITNLADVIFNGSYSNRIATNTYSGYGFNVAFLDEQVPRVPGISSTNFPGRVEIFGNNLNVNRTRIRADSVTAIRTDNLLGTTNIVIDSPVVSLDMVKPSGLLSVQGVVRDTIERTAGNVFLWSGIWTNVTALIAPNPAFDPAGDTNEFVTNTVEIGFHVFIVDARELTTQQPVLTRDFRVTAPSLAVGDTLRFTNSVQINSANIQILPTGSFQLGGTDLDWNRLTFPLTRNLTNDGIIALGDDGHFGALDDPEYNIIVNRGAMAAADFLIRARSFENRGAIAAGSQLFGPFGFVEIRAGSATLDGGSIEAGGHVILDVGDLKMRGHAISTEQSFTLAARNSVADNPEDEPNEISSEGFNLVTKPSLGDLLGTTINSTAPAFLAIPHKWAGEDRGASAAGFANNVAIGRVVLEGGFDSQFVFSGTGARNGLYVDFLELGDTVRADIQNALRIEPNLVIYFADSNVPANELNGLFADEGAPEGRLRWVPEFAGPNSSVDVVLRSENRSVQMNRQLRESATLDSDNDGIPNQSDAFPLDPDVAGVALNGAAAFSKQSSTVSFSWDAQGNTAYIVEFSDSLTNPNWQVLTEYTHRSKSGGRATIQDKLPEGVPQRYYRVQPR